MTVKARQFLDKQEVDRDVLEMARDRAERIFARFDTVSVAFSGGKDSTAALHVTLEAATEAKRLPLDVVFIDEEAIPPETEEYVRRVAARDDVRLRWISVPVRHLNACSRQHPWWSPWDPDLRHLWVREMPPESISSLEGLPLEPMAARLQHSDISGLFFDPSTDGTVAWVMGIRADESMTRTRAVTRRKEDGWIVHDTAVTNPGNVWKCYPVYDFRTVDCWTLAKMVGDHNRAYDLQELHGFHGSRQRIAPPFGREPLQMLGMYATCWPDLWDRMVDRVPGAATAARYSRTELYSFRGRPEPGEGETWKELINRLLSRHEAKVQAEVRARLVDEIGWHYSKTNNPILPTAPHPVTGMSAQWLAMIALIADLKKRKVAGWELGEDSPEQRAKIAAAYREQAATNPETI